MIIYVFGVVVCLVIICNWWIISCAKIVGDDLVNVWRCVYIDAYYEPCNIM